jgi:hypothetical protein
MNYLSNLKAPILIFAGVIDKFEINPNDKGLSYPFV